MFIRILGWLWVITGVLFLLRPQWLKKRLQKKNMRLVRKYLFFIAVALGILLISVSWKIPGLLSKVIMIIGIAGIIKGFFFLKAKAADKTIQTLASRPLALFRVLALAYIVVGLMVLLLHK